MVADAPPTHVMRRQLPWKLEFATLVKCVGGVFSPRSGGCHLSWSITDRLKPISHPHTSNPRLQAAHKFLLDFGPLRIFSKMFLTTEIAQILPGGLIWPTLQSEKKNLGVRKKRLIPYFQAPQIYKRLSIYFEIIYFRFYSEFASRVKYQQFLSMR